MSIHMLEEKEEEKEGGGTGVCSIYHSDILSVVRTRQPTEGVGM